MTTTYATYAETPVYMHPAVLSMPVSSRWPVAAPHRVSADDVCELIDAAGPLTVSDIAGGLDVSAAEVTLIVRRLVAAGCLRVDEWERARVVSDACRAAA